MYIISVVLFIQVFSFTTTKDIAKYDEYIISCHTTDLECFRRQYRALRDHILLGNDYLGINAYQPYIFRYGDTGTCIKVSGVQDSELAGITMNSKVKEYTIVLEMPVRIQQIKNDSVICARPDKEFEETQQYTTGPMKKFSGNATVQVTYPYKLHKRKGRTYMEMDEQNLDVILDIPDLGQYDKESALEVKLYEWSEWAYEVIQHIDLAQHCLVPYTGILNLVMKKIPLDRFIMLYPDESFSQLKFSYSRPIDIE